MEINNNSEISGITAPAGGRCVCLDCEFADGRELLELSVYDYDGTELYTHRFKPRTLRRWMTEPHNITPAMVAGEPLFADCVPQIQRLLSRAEYVVGFAVKENDLPKLSAEGIQGLYDKKIIDLRDLFWLVEGRERGLDLFQGRNLAACCEDLGVELGEAAHSASADTVATMQCVRILLERFAAQLPETASGPVAFDDVARHYLTRYAEAKDIYDREQAAGYAYLLMRPDGYMLKIRRERLPATDERVVAEVPVADRKRAENDLRERLRNKRLGERDVYRLSENDIRRFRSYTNEYNPEFHALLGGAARLKGHFGAIGGSSFGTSRRRR